MKRLLIPLVLFMFAAAWWWTQRGAAPKDEGFLGYVEGALVYVGPVEGERIASLRVESGQSVKKGDLLFVMATPLLDSQRESALARIREVEAQGKNLRAAINRPEQIAVLEAAAERAKAALDLSRSDYERQRTLYAKGHVAKAALDRAAMAMKRDEATLKEARRQIAVGRMPSRTQEIAASSEAREQARAQLEQLDVRIARSRVAAPAAGVVQDVFFREGEMVNAGQPVLSLLPPENRKTTFYVPEPQLSRFALGARVRVTCDACPEHLYGRVTFLASRQEYTPPVIFSEQERAKLVFKAQARLEGEARRLPVGLPVTVRLAPEDPVK